MGIVARQHLASQECELVCGRTSSHKRLRVRMKREDYEFELRKQTGPTSELDREYELLISTGKGAVPLELENMDELVLTWKNPVCTNDKFYTITEIPCVVSRVRAVMAGLRSSEKVHRALVVVCVK